MALQHTSDYLTNTGSFEPSAESHPARIGHITLDVKHTGKPSAGNLHAGFDEAGAGNQRTIRLVRHSQRKRGATDRLNLRRLAPVLDPTSRWFERLLAELGFEVGSSSLPSPTILSTTYAAFTAL
jgi:hypothetical protein